MKHTYWRNVLHMLLIAAACIMIGGCDSGKEAIDEATGHRAFKQYQKSKKDIEKITEKQAKRYEGIPDDKEGEDEEEE
jgi:hypothetical protein